MTKSKVYFTNMRVDVGSSLLVKLQDLMKAAGIDQINFDKQFAAIKIHFGEPGNLAYLRPNYSKVVVDMVKSLGGKPFLTDCNTLYVGGRKNALDHLDSAYLNGFSPFSTGCHVIIADGLKGTDETLVPLPDGKHVKEAKIGRAIMDADIFISLNHVKGHESAGFGGALKNIGMGCGSRAGKMEMHNAGKPNVSDSQCIGCSKCTKQCAHEAISVNAKKAKINHDNCVGCGRCIGVCPVDAIYTNWDESNSILCEKIAEYSAAVLRDRPHFHINWVIDVSPYCDCHSENDAPIVGDIGMFASFDPVALDVACVEAINKQHPLPGSLLDDVLKSGTDHHDHFTTVSPNTQWRSVIDHSITMGIGTDQYEIIEV